jgi:hypothetical protein
MIRDQYHKKMKKHIDRLLQDKKKLNKCSQVILNEKSTGDVVSKIPSLTVKTFGLNDNFIVVENRGHSTSALPFESLVAFHRLECFVRCSEVPCCASGFWVSNTSTPNCHLNYIKFSEENRVEEAGSCYFHREFAGIVVCRYCGLTIFLLYLVFSMHRSNAILVLQNTIELKTILLRL